MSTRPSRPLPPAVAACRGLSPQRRAALMAAAKSRAVKFVTAVRARSAHQVQVISRDFSAGEWKAMALVLAEAADPQRLLAVVQSGDDGLPDGITARRGSAA